jgi:hypothetical protein
MLICPAFLCLEPWAIRTRIGITAVPFPFRSKQDNLNNSDMTADLTSAAILAHLNELIRLQNGRLENEDCRGKPADDTGDWLAINFLFRVGREYPRLSVTARDQLDVIFHGWTSPEPLALQEFTAMLGALRAVIAADATNFKAA